MTARVTLYGRTHLDAEVTIPVDVLAEGKGKVDVAVTPVLGGFACNAARALVGRLPKQSVHVVTVTAAIDLPRLRAAVPDEVVLDAIVSSDVAWPRLGVIINPAGNCRLLRDPSDGDAADWSAARVALAAIVSRLHVFGRLPLRFIAELAPQMQRAGARVAWVGGAALPRDLETQFDFICVNVAEAQQLLGSDADSPHELASGLANRARAGAVRLVTGRGAAPAVAAVCTERSVVLHERAPAAIPRPKIRRLKGVGDVFAAQFVVDACFDGRGKPRARLDVAGALATAQHAAATFIRRGKP